MKPNLQTFLRYWLPPMLLLLAFQLAIRTQGSVESIPYSQFRTALQAGEIQSVRVGDNVITGTYKTTGADGKPRQFTTVPVAPELADALAAAKVEFSAAPGPGLFMRLVGWILPTLLFIGVWLLVLRRMAGGTGAAGLTAIGKSKAKVYLERDIRITFADVAGVDEAKEELQEVIRFLREPKSYGRLGAHMPKGILLVGPPGTGKTLLARAVAGEAGVPFFSISGSEFVELFVGVGAARVRDLFEQARANAPCIIFIDELDAVGRARGASFPGGGHDEKEQTLNQLLNELDGFDPSSGVVLLAATNRPEILDPALLRSGRFDRQILVDRPDKSARLAILQVHLRKLVLSSDVDKEQIAALTTGFSGADLANLANEAALLATRRGADAVTADDLLSALERIIAGLEKRSRVLTPKERKVVAFHEVGHALVALALSQETRVQKISIVPRGIGALGYTIQRPTEDRFLMGRPELQQRMAVLLGGRAAEMLEFGEVSTGAADDLAKATDIARSMVTQYGMVAELGTVSYEPDASTVLGVPLDTWRPRQYAEVTAAAIDLAVKHLLDEALLTALDVLRRYRSGLEQAAARLLQCETLGGEELRTIIEGAGEPLPAATAQPSEPAETVHGAAPASVAARR